LQEEKVGEPGVVKCHAKMNVQKYA